MTRLLAAILTISLTSAKWSQAQTVHVHEVAAFSFDPLDASPEPADFGGLFVTTEPTQGWNPAEGTLIYGETEVSLELTCRFQVENVGTQWQRILVQHYMNAPVLFLDQWHNFTGFGYGADAWLFPGESLILETYEHFTRATATSNTRPLDLWELPQTIVATAHIQRITLPQVPDLDPDFDIELLSVEGALYVDVTFIVITSSQTDITALQHRLLQWLFDQEEGIDTMTNGEIVEKIGRAHKDFFKLMSNGEVEAAKLVALEIRKSWQGLTAGLEDGESISQDASEHGVVSGDELIAAADAWIP